MAVSEDVRLTMKANAPNMEGVLFDPKRGRRLNLRLGQIKCVSNCAADTGQFNEGFWRVIEIIEAVHRSLGLQCGSRKESGAHQIPQEICCASIVKKRLNELFAPRIRLELTVGL